ncbi:hypothetical protein [Streptomyces sp. NPDC017868]
MHPLQIYPAYAEPGRGLLRPERRLTAQQLGQALPRVATTWST